MFVFLSLSTTITKSVSVSCWQCVFVWRSWSKNIYDTPPDLILSKQNIGGLRTYNLL